MVPIKILHITPFFPPNIGGVETHLSDLTSTLSTMGYKNYVLTYSPITTPSTPYKPIEIISPNLIIRRFPWFGFNLFNLLEKYPLINFFYITPYLLIRSIIYLSIHRPKIDVIHSHGLNGAIIGIILKYIFNINRHIVSIYSSYDHVPKSSQYISAILNHTDVVLTQSNRSLKQLNTLGVNKNILHRYRHWIDLNVFKPKKINKLPKTILFIGRMIPQKNALLLAKTAKFFPNYNFEFIGNGPDYKKILLLSKKYRNIKLIGNVDYSKLPYYYQTADIFCLPSKYDEGWGRVIMESIACGLPILATNQGAVPEVVNSTVAVLFSPTLSNLKIHLSNIDPIISLNKNCRSYALKHFSVKNIDLITRFYINT